MATSVSASAAICFSLVVAVSLCSMLGTSLLSPSACQGRRAWAESKVQW